MKIHTLLLLPALAVIAACGSNPERGNISAQPATEKVIGGTISDAMLPLDSATSTSPLEAGSDGRETRNSGSAATPAPAVSPDAAIAPVSSAAPSGQGSDTQTQ